MPRVLGAIGHLVLVTLRTLGGVIGAVFSGGVLPPQHPGRPAPKGATSTGRDLVGGRGRRLSER